jgi:ACS family hexuronate transporter-like MFS transporter
VAETELKTGEMGVGGQKPAAFKLRGLRWIIIGLIFLATLINYLDRLALSNLAPFINKELGLTNTDYSNIVFWFLLAYTVSQGLSGKLYDRIGPRRGFTLSVIVWSIAAMVHAFGRGASSLSAFRFALGLGEAGNWPGAAKVAAEWFPVRERAFAMSIFNSGAAIGSIIAPLTILPLGQKFGWQTAFIAVGALGFFWLALWLLCYQTPERHRWLTNEEYELIRGGQNTDGETGKQGAGAKEGGARSADFAPAPRRPVSQSLPLSASPAGKWRDLLRYKQVWAIVLSRLLVDPVWWLYISWLPLYLNTSRGFDVRKLIYFSWLPYVAADAGSLFGGWASGHLIKRGWSVDRARKSVIVAMGLLMPAGILAARSAEPMVALAWICVVLFGFQAWINNVQTLPSDFFSEKVVASVAGLGGVGAGVGSMIFTLLTGRLVDKFGYVPALTVAGLLAPLGTLVLFALSGRINKIQDINLKPRITS